MITKDKDPNSGNLFKPPHLPLWIACLVLGATLFYFVGRLLDRRQELAGAWNANDRVGLAALEGLIPSIQTTNAFLVAPLLEAEKAFVAQFGKDTPDGAAALNRLANMYALQGDYLAAEAAYREVRIVLGEHLGPEHPDVVLVEGNLRTLQTLRTNPVPRGVSFQTNGPATIEGCAGSPTPP